MRFFVVLLCVSVTSSCGASQKPPGCTEADEAAIDAEFQARMLEKCLAYAPTENLESCPEYEAIDKDYKRKSQEWYVRCHP